jgi:sugar (pentulose or hexulose) kinase
MLLGLDLGTSSVKTLVLDEGGEVCGEGSAPCRVDAPPPGRGRTHELAVAAA